MNEPIAERFAGVTVFTKANVYFDGGVVSHTLIFPDQSKKTLGLIRPGKYHFATQLAEGMEIVAGACTVKIDGSIESQLYQKGQCFEIPGTSGFDIEVTQGICEYICSFLP